MSKFTLTYNTGKLMSATGYWSGKKILCNLNKSLLFLPAPLSMDAILDQVIHLQEHTAKTHLKIYFTKWIGKNYLGAFRLNSVLVSISWQEMQKQLRAKRFNKSRISRHVAELWWQQHKNSPAEKIETTKLDRIPPPLAPLIVDWPSLVPDNRDNTDDFLLKIGTISQIKTQPDPKAFPGYSKLSLAAKNRASLACLSMEERSLVEWILPFLAESPNEKQYFYGVNLAVQACSALLAWLRARELLILPINLENIYSRLPEFEAWPKRLLSSEEAASAIKAGLPKLIATTNTFHIDDIPTELRSIYSADLFSPAFYKNLSNWLQHPAIRKKRPVFPVDHLQASYLDKNSHTGMWTPAWVKQNCNDEWYDFANLWWLHKASDSHKRNALRNFLEWAWYEHGFESPWKITHSDLRNPHRPAYTGTYFNYLKEKDIQDKSSCWSNSANLFRIVVQHANLPESPVLVHGKIINPFKSLSNPFRNRRRKSRKTHRSSIPATIHEMMIEILLSPNSDGYPTFSWAKRAITGSGRDIVRVPDPDNPKKIIETWCPSRATCLAILLLTPMRSVQARWLDQGLMDEECYDLEAKAMVPNLHPLRNFKYPNGNSHSRQYGRPSGVLQFSSDLLTKQQALSIFVNTNKTQLWDPTRISGYEIPWPDGADLLLSDEPEQRAKGKWLARVYRVIEYQMKWMARHDPFPQPVGFLHCGSDKSRTSDLVEIKESLPWFVPLFRDLSKFVSYSVGNKTEGGYCPATRAKINHLYNLLAVETEKQFEKKYGRKIYLTVPDKNNGTPRCRFDLHSLRVTWVSRLFEMGIPVHIISEFFVGHATKLMTIMYLKIRSAHAREALIQAAVQGESKSGLEALIERNKQKENWQDELVGPDGIDNLFEYLPKDFVAIAPVDGGICPMGGRGSRCRDGSILSSTEKASGRKPGPVQGGCGNCRFFLTGPDFLFEQLRACNILMIKMRSLGKEQKRLYIQADEIRWKIHDLSSQDIAKKQALEFQRSVLSERINEYNEKLSPLIQEWCNRYEMLITSGQLLRSTDNPNERQPTLLGHQPLTVNDYDVIAQGTTEFGLVRGLIEQARIVTRQGYPLPEEPGRMLREFMTILLAESSPGNLLLRIPDELYATHAASVLAGWLYDEFGDSAIQECIDQRKALPMTGIQNEQLQSFTERLVAGLNIENQTPDSVLLPNQGQGRMKK